MYFNLSSEFRAQKRNTMRRLYLTRKVKYILITALAVYVLFTIISRKNGKNWTNPVTSGRLFVNNSTTPLKDVLEGVDWNNYSLMESDSKRSGLAEQGIGVALNLTNEQNVERQKLLDKYKYDAYLSDRISVERSIGDIRPEACKRVKYIKDIPENSVSIIIPMFNEKNSTLLRTIHSIINRSPAILLKEVIVVDDCSQEDELKAPLDDYVREHFSKVKIIRNKQREGLIRSRMIGADASTGSFLVFVDSHMEVNYNYLPPLLEIMVLNYRTIACPTIDFVTKQFKIDVQADKRIRGGFTWTLGYKRLPVTAIMDEVTPHASPIMVGCAFAISRKWWNELDKFDQGLDVWGFEQFELSVKSWLCGGSVVDSPCSRIAHVFRELPYVNDAISVSDKNIVRFATVWMDGYREVLFHRKPHLRNIDPGSNILKQIELRQRLHCKSFDWFLKEVAPDILELFPIQEPSYLAWGHLISKFNSSLCVNVKDKQLYLADCNDKEISGFMYDWRYHIIDNRGKCFYGLSPQYLNVGECYDIELKDYLFFAWEPNSGRLVHPASGRCVDFKEESLPLFLSECVDTKISQSWTFETFNVTRVVEAWNRHTQSH